MFLSGKKILQPVSRHHSLPTLLVALLLVILIPILALQYYNYRWSSDVITQELTDSASANVSYLRESFSEKITAIIEQQEYLLSAYSDVSSYLTYARSLSPGERYVLESRLADHILNICYGHPLIQSLSLYYPTLNRQFSVSYEDNGTSLIKNISGISDLAQLVERFNERNTVVQAGNGALFLIHGKRIGSGLPQYLTHAALKTDAIAKLLGAYGVYPSQKAYLLHWNSGTVISGSEQDQRFDADLSRQFTPRNSPEVYRFSFDSGSQHFIAFCADIPQFGVTFIHLIESSTMGAIPNRLRTLFIMTFLLMLLVTLLYFIFIHRTVSKPIRALMECFEAAGQGDLGRRMDACHTNEFLSLSSGYNTMADRLDRLISEHYQQTILLQQAQLRQLHSQIEPHFLYNSFFMLRHTIASEDIDKAEKICGYLGNYFQFITRLDSQFLPLREEYDNVMNYVAIQSMRFASRLQTRIDPLPGPLSSCIVPVLIVQPLIENAIVHGIPSQSGVLRLSFQDGQEDFFIDVEDNGNTLSDGRIRELNDLLHAPRDIQGSHALMNIHHRLTLCYGPEYGLSFSHSSLGGLRVSMRIRKTFKSRINQEGT